jgi:hypothetical protein
MSCLLGQILFPPAAHFFKGLPDVRFRRESRSYRTHDGWNARRALKIYKYIHDKRLFTPVAQII